MRWFRRDRGGIPIEAVKARLDAQERTRRMQAQTAEVVDLGNRMRRIREENHLAARFRAAVLGEDEPR